MSVSEKDSIVEDALGMILTERIEGQIINEDYTGYWDLMLDTLFKISINNFIDGIDKFYDAMKRNDKKKELNTYHIKFMMRCISSEVIMTAANNLYAVLKENLVHRRNDIPYDVMSNNAVIDFENIEKILLFLYIYEDRISIGTQDFLLKKSPPTKKGGNK